MLQCMSKVNLTRFSNELLPVHSPLLRQSQLISFPLLINMLKFSKYSNLTSAWNVERLCQWKYIDSHLYTRIIQLFRCFCFFIDNMDMIKISHVMTIDTNKYRCILCIVYNFVLDVYNNIQANWMSCMLDMYCKLNKNEFYWTCQQFI